MQISGAALGLHHLLGALKYMLKNTTAGVAVIMR